MSLPAGFQAGRVQRLLLGIHPADALSGDLPVAQLRVEIERALPHAGLAGSTPACVPQIRGRRPRALCRHDSGRFALLYQAGLGDSIDLRIDDTERRYIPRRMRVPLLTLAQIETAEGGGDGADLSNRSRAPILFPGAAYPLISSATGLRGRVLRAGEPVRWALVEAMTLPPDPLPDPAPAEDLLVRTRADDRGEFLLLLPPRAGAGADLPQQIPLRIAVSGPNTVPVPADAALPGLDPLWDLPRDDWSDAADPDPIDIGQALPSGWRRSASTRDIDFTPGRVLTGADLDTDFIFS